MNDRLRETPVFEKKSNPNQRLVRFWCDANIYAEFQEAVKRSGLSYRAVFITLMRWFIDQEQAGALEVK